MMKEEIVCISFAQMSCIASEHEMTDGGKEGKALNA